jgi:hypothetical protein
MREFHHAWHDKEACLSCWSTFEKCRPYKLSIWELPWPSHIPDVFSSNGTCTTGWFWILLGPLRSNSYSGSQIWGDSPVGHWWRLHQPFDHTRRARGGVYATKLPFRWDRPKGPKWSGVAAKEKSQDLAREESRESRMCCGCGEEGSWGKGAIHLRNPRCFVRGDTSWPNGSPVVGQKKEKGFYTYRRVWDWVPGVAWPWFHVVAGVPHGRSNLGHVGHWRVPLRKLPWSVSSLRLTKGHLTQLETNRAQRRCPTVRNESRTARRR